MRPQLSTVVGGKRVKLVLDRDGKDPAIRNGRRAVHRSGDVLAPDHLAVGGIERQHLGIPGRDVKPVIPEARPAAERVAAHSFRF